MKVRYCDAMILDDANKLLLAAFCEKLRKRHANCLGFFPESAFLKAIQRNRMIAAYVYEKLGSDQRTWLGYVLFATKFPTARIFQCCVVRESRRQGIARELVEMFETHDATRRCVSIALRCREDLQANKFWKKIGYQHLSTIDGRNTTGLRINQWVKVFPNYKLRSDLRIRTD